MENSPRRVNRFAAVPGMALGLHLWTSESCCAERRRRFSPPRRGCDQGRECRCRSGPNYHCCHQPGRMPICAMPAVRRLLVLSDAGAAAAVQAISRPISLSFKHVVVSGGGATGRPGLHFRSATSRGFLRRNSSERPRVGGDEPWFWLYSSGATARARGTVATCIRAHETLLAGNGAAPPRLGFEGKANVDVVSGVPVVIRLRVLVISSIPLAVGGATGRGLMAETHQA